VKAVSEYLGHTDPGFTLRTYTHLLPTSHERTRRAVTRCCVYQMCTLAMLALHLRRSAVMCDYMINM
jgi:integrase